MLITYRRYYIIKPDKYNVGRQTTVPSDDFVSTCTFISFYDIHVDGIFNVCLICLHGNKNVYIRQHYVEFHTVSDNICWHSCLVTIENISPIWSIEKCCWNCIVIDKYYTKSPLGLALSYPDQQWNTIQLISVQNVELNTNYS